MLRESLLLDGGVVGVYLGDQQPPPQFPTSTLSPTAIPSGSESFPFLVSNQFFLLADSVLDFDIQSFLDTQNGPLKNYREPVQDEIWTAAEIILYEASEYGLNPQVLITYFEAEAHLISNPIVVIPENFLLYVKGVAERLSEAFYQYRDHRETAMIRIPSGQIYPPPQNLNAGTYAIIRSLAEVLSADGFRDWITGDNARYLTQFETWFPDSNDINHPPVVVGEAIPSGFSLPFGLNQTWRYIGGPRYLRRVGSGPVVVYRSCTNNLYELP